MPDLTVRDIPHEVYKSLKERAVRHRRSLSAEVVTLLESLLQPVRSDEDPFVQEAVSFHNTLSEPMPDYIGEAVREGRK